MNETMIEEIYYTLIGEMVSGAEVPGVNNLFVPGSECYRLFDEQYHARDRLLERLGVMGEDPDLETVIANGEQIQMILAMEMFRLGLHFREL
ncbi:MAG: hypothetical protein IKC09_03850 [Oscillospiraceae bacterium]|nr:hypothetical protein [Oscillospiraceae bacterium]